MSIPKASLYAIISFLFSSLPCPPSPRSIPRQQHVVAGLPAALYSLPPFALLVSSAALPGSSESLCDHGSSCAHSTRHFHLTGNDAARRGAIDSLTDDLRPLPLSDLYRPRRNYCAQKFHQLGDTHLFARLTRLNAYTPFVLVLVR